jgi:16S rRNA (guanine(966)-N(2))-methyltransferase RsmD
MPKKRKKSKQSTDLRPTSGKVKLALFNILYDVSNKKFLDLFAGTGEIGLTALKKGAESSTFVELNKRRASDIKNRVSKEFSNYKVISGDSIKFLKGTEDKFDIIFADPPYNYQKYDTLIEEALKKLSENGVFILEHRADREFDADDSRKYGDTVLSFWYKE